MTGVVFLCVHNAGRSQMAVGFARSMGCDDVRIYSGGSEPADRVNAVASVDVVVTVGCGDTCPYIPGKRYIDWPLDDPRGQSIEFGCRVRDDIRRHVIDLLAELDPNQ